MENRGRTAVRGGGLEEEEREAERQTLSPPSTLVTIKICSTGEQLTRTNQRPGLKLRLFKQ